VIFTLCRASVREEQFSLFNEAQRTAVRRYLEFTAEDKGYEFDRPDIKLCLATYWT
jgi:hypothetical protein